MNDALVFCAVRQFSAWQRQGAWQSYSRMSWRRRILTAFGFYSTAINQYGLFNNRRHLTTTTTTTPIPASTAAGQSARGTSAACRTVRKQINTTEWSARGRPTRWHRGDRDQLKHCAGTQHQCSGNVGAERAILDSCINNYNTLAPSYDRHRYFRHSVRASSAIVDSWAALTRVRVSYRCNNRCNVNAATFCCCW